MKTPKSITIKYDEKAKKAVEATLTELSAMDGVDIQKRNVQPQKLAGATGEKRV
ncbi:MAG: hypothetical protein Q8N15_06330 [Bacillota bacterium]|nr:hypothetical protein [Bacillota bacterium]